METVEVVIKIPKDMYDRITDESNMFYSHAIANGTVLPKGHGRLGDLDRLVRTEIQHLLYHLPNGDIAVPKIDIDNAPTVIEADREVEE